MKRIGFTWRNELGVIVEYYRLLNEMVKNRFGDCIPRNA